jgi:hypothetical protein
MARQARAPKVEEIFTPDYAGAVRTYRTDIRSAEGKIGGFAQEMSTAFKHIKKNCHINPGAARLAFKLDRMEEAARDDFLRSLNGLMTELKIFMPKDMLDIANGASATSDESVIPVGERERPRLVTVHGGFDADAPQGPEGDGDLALEGENVTE